MRDTYYHFLKTNPKKVFTLIPAVKNSKIPSVLIRYNTLPSYEESSEEDDDHEDGDHEDGEGCDPNNPKKIIINNPTCILAISESFRESGWTDTNFSLYVNRPHPNVNFRAGGGYSSFTYYNQPYYYACLGDYYVNLIEPVKAISEATTHQQFNELTKILAVKLYVYLGTFNSYGYTDVSECEKFALKCPICKKSNKNKNTCCYADKEISICTDCVYKPLKAFDAPKGVSLINFMDQNPNRGVPKIPQSFNHKKLRLSEDKNAIIYTGK